VRQPKIFLFDEPLSNLDAALRSEMRIELMELHKRLGSTMIYVTHDQIEAMTLASRIVVLAGGGISQVGTPMELYERPENEFVAQFIGSPAMNLLAGEIVETGDETVIRLASGGIARSSIRTQVSDLGMKVNLGVRPEDLVPATGEPLFSGEVEITEALGEVTLLYFQRQGEGAQQVVAKLPGIHPRLRHTTVSLTADPRKIHLFHQGKSLLYRHA
jgi:alpha-glucoside transport system ATP-binding protein